MCPSKSLFDRSVLALHYRARGQALVELLIFFPLIIALVAGIFTLGYYVQVKALAVNTARFSAWERSVYADPDHLWSGDADWEGADQPSLNATARRDAEQVVADGLAYLSSPNFRIVSSVFGDGSENWSSEPIAGSADSAARMWGGKPLSITHGAGGRAGDFARDSAGLTQSDTSEDGLASLKARTSASEHWDRVCTGYGDAVDKRPGGTELEDTRWRQRCDSYLKMPGESLSDLSGSPIANTGHRLNRDFLVREAVHLSIRDVFRENSWQIALLNLAEFDASARRTIDIDAVAGLYVNAWSPKNEETFARKVGGLDTGPFLRGVQVASNKMGDGFRSLVPGLKAQMSQSVPFLDTFFMQPESVDLTAYSHVQLFTRSIPGGVTNHGLEGPIPNPDGGLE